MTLALFHQTDCKESLIFVDLYLHVFDGTMCRIFLIGTFYEWTLTLILSVQVFQFFIMLDTAVGFTSYICHEDEFIAAKDLERYHCIGRVSSMRCKAK